MKLCVSVSSFLSFLSLSFNFLYLFYKTLLCFISLFLQYLEILRDNPNLQAHQKHNKQITSLLLSLWLGSDSGVNWVIIRQILRQISGTVRDTAIYGDIASLGRAE